MSAKVLVTGATGQDGSYLCELLLSKGYSVHGTHRFNSNPKRLQRLKHCIDHKNFKLVMLDMTDALSVQSLVSYEKYDFIYHMADQDSVAFSYNMPSVSFDTTIKGSYNILQSAYTSGKITQKIFIPTSCTMFDNSIMSHHLHMSSRKPEPKSPYAIAKTCVHNLINYYRERFLNIYEGIMFPHTSPRQSKHYLIQRILWGVCEYSRNINKPLNNVFLSENRIDVGYAPEYMDGVIKFVESDKTIKTLVFATGIHQRVTTIIQKALAQMGFDPQREYIELQKNSYKHDHSQFLDVICTKSDIEITNIALGWKATVNVDNMLKKLLSEPEWKDY